MNIILEGTGYAGKTISSKDSPYYISEVSKKFGNVVRRLLRKNEFFDTGNDELETVLLAIDWNIKLAESRHMKHRIFDRGLYSIVAYQAVKKHINFGIDTEPAAEMVLQTCKLVSEIMNSELIPTNSKTVLLITDAQTLTERYKIRNGTLKEKSIKRLLEIQEFYIDFKPASWLQIDTSEKSISEVSDFIYSLVDD